MRHKVLVIVGPTASGKSDLAVRLAKKFSAKGGGGEIISADSRQVYKGLNIGTGKITKKEMGGIKHHLLDVAEPKKQFSVAEYRDLATDSIANIIAKGKLPIIVGGTGFYIDAITDAINFPDIPPNPTLRKRLEKKTTEELFKILQKKDQKRAKTIDAKNKVRLIRALEIVEALGSVPKARTKSPDPRTYIYIGLKPDDLEKKIYKRLLNRLSGMIAEGKRLHKQGLSYKRMHELGLEYRHIALYLQGKLNKTEMVEKLNIAIRQYAKRQRLWFKRNNQIRWFKPSDFKKIEKYAAK